MEVSEYFELARFGQIVLTAEDAPYQFTHDNAAEHHRLRHSSWPISTRRRIYPRRRQQRSERRHHECTGAPDEPYPYPSDGLALDNRFRVGDSIEGLTGVMEWSFAGATGTDAWRIRPIPGETYTFASDNPPPSEPEDVGGTLQVATFNVLNFFTTIDQTSSNSVGVWPVRHPRLPRRRLGCRAGTPARRRSSRHSSRWMPMSSG